MSLGEIFVLADEENDLIPEILHQMRFQPVTNGLGFPDINRGIPTFGINASQQVNTGMTGFLASGNSVELAPGPSHGLAGPVGQFGSAKTLGIPMNQENLDGGAGHAVAWG